jgi:hypothetical protein
VGKGEDGFRAHAQVSLPGGGVGSLHRPVCRGCRPVFSPGETGRTRRSAPTWGRRAGTRVRRHVGTPGGHAGRALHAMGLGGDANSGASLWYVTQTRGIQGVPSFG